MTHLINNRYQLESLIGQGGMGAVYKAFDRLKQHYIAFKKVSVPQSNIDIITQSTATTSHNDILAHEFRTLATLRHPNIISVLDYGFENDTTPFFTMDLMEDAVPITDYVTSKSIKDRIRYLVDVLQALRYLHQRGIVHRDLKPANILVANDKVKVLDFGLALDAKYSQEHADAAGTLAYLAPEVLQGKAPSKLSDLYAFGVLAYQILTGDYPFPHTTPSQLIQQVLLDAPTFEEIDLDDALSNVIMRLLSKSPDDRYQSAIDAIKALSNAAGINLALETQDIRESFLVASTFVGRTEEINLLKNRLSKMTHYESQSVLIGGESGIGKTRLMDELRAYALVEGITVLRGQAITQNNLAYKIWVDILPELLLLNDVNDDVAGILALFMPNISDLLARDIIPSTLPKDSVKRRLPLIISTLIQEASVQTPLMILLEDLQWATEDIDILHAVLGSLGHHRVMIVGNYRNDEAPHLADNLAMEHLLLQRLSDDNIKTLSMSMLGKQGDSEGVLELLKRESEGNAFFLVEVVRALAEEVGQITNIGQATLPAQVFAGGIQNIIQRRLAKLPDWALSPVQVNSLLGRQIDKKIIEHIFPTLDIDAWLQICGDVAIFAVDGDDWQFIHDKIREYMIGQLDDETKQHISLDIADAIETVYKDDLERFYSDLADYYLEADNLEKTKYYAMKGAETLRVYDAQRAYELIQLAITLSDETNKEELANHHHLKGNIAIILNQFDEANEALNMALEMFKDIDDDYGIAKVKNNLGELGYRRNELDGTLQLLQESLPVLEAHEDWFYVATVYMHMSLIVARQESMADALPYFQKCLDVMLITKDEVEIAKAYNNLGMALEALGDLPESFNMYQKSLAIRRRLNDRNGLITSLHNLAFVEQAEGRYAESIEMRLEALTYAKQVKHIRGQMIVLTELALTEYIHQGNVDIAISYTNECLEIAKNVQNIRMINQAYIRLGRFLSKQNIYEARTAFLTGLQGLKSTDMNNLKAEGIGHLSILLYQQQVIDIKTYIEWLSATLQYKSDFQKLSELETALNTIKDEVSQAIFDDIVKRGQEQDINTIIDRLLELGDFNSA